MKPSRKNPNRVDSRAFSLWRPLVLIGESGSDRRGFPRLVYGPSGRNTACFGPQNKRQPPCKLHLSQYAGGNCALGSAVIPGHKWFTEVDTVGSILSRTGISPKYAHLFVPAGQHWVSYRLDICCPSDSGHDLWATRLAHFGHI